MPNTKEPSGAEGRIPIGKGRVTASQVEKKERSPCRGLMMRAAGGGSRSVRGGKMGARGSHPLFTILEKGGGTNSLWGRAVGIVAKRKSICIRKKKVRKQLSSGGNFLIFGKRTLSIRTKGS